MAHTFSNFVSHIIFSTKDRLPYMTPEIQGRLWGYMGGILQEERAIPLTIGGTADHVHLLIKFSPTRALSDSIRVLKTNSSRWVHETWPGLPFAWQTGYGSFSVSQSRVEDVRRYIAHQEVHHRNVTFQEEFVMFLERHGIAYDPKYIWE